MAYKWSDDDGEGPVQWGMIVVLGLFAVAIFVLALTHNLPGQ